MEKMLEAFLGTFLGTCTTERVLKHFWMQVGRQVGIFCHKKYLQIMKELKIYKYTKNTKKQINTEFMAGMTQKELKQPYFHCGPF